MKNGFRTLWLGVLVPACCLPQLAFSECMVDAVNGTVCQPAGPVAVGAVFSTSDSGARRNVSLSLVEELLEEEADELGDESGSGAGDSRPFDVYASVLYADKDFDTREVPGFDSDTRGVVIGITLRGKQYFTGAAMDYSEESATYKENVGDQDTDELGIQLYGTYYPLASKQLFLTGAFRYGSQGIETRRTFSGIDNQLSTARGNTDGTNYGLLGGTGYSWPIQSQTILSLSGWLSWQQNDTDGYTESGALPQDNGITNFLTGNLRFDDDSYSTLDGILTASLLHEISISNGRLLPSLALSYVHEFESDTRTINVEVIDAPDGNPEDKFFSFRTNEADKNYFRIGASLAAQFNQGTTIYATYNGILSHDWRNENLFSVGLSQAF